MFETLSIIEQAVRTVRQENRQGSPANSRSAGLAMVRARPRRNSTPPIRSRADYLTHAVGDILSLTAPEFSGGVSGGSSEQRLLPPCRIRTDRGKNKKRQESEQGPKSPELQGFLALQGYPVPGKQPETAADANGRSAPI